jgi:UDP-N-acetylglucosamine--dolichyl-phosphate N-acetylglucosaminephosphotransferase
MELIYLLFLGGISFIITSITLPSWMRRARDTGLMGKDVHKDNKEVPELGGITVILGAVISLLVYIALETFYFKGDSVELLLAAVATLLIATMIGMTDDMLGWRIGLRQREKTLLTLLVPVPMVVVNAGHSVMKFPLIGSVELGLIYPLLIVPIGIIGATNGFNMLAGFNGLEAGMGIIILSTLGYFSWLVGSLSATLVAVCFVSAMGAFLFYNKFPSKVFPGDVLTYPVGAGIATVAVLANLERFALMLFFPYYIEFLLKARGKFNPDWEARVLEDGSLDNKGKLYSLPHGAISFLKRLRERAYENEIVIVILIFEIIIAFVTLISF